MRNDLTNEDKCVQVAHAAMDSQREFCGNRQPIFLVVCVVKNESGLLKLKDELKGLDIRFCETVEPDLGSTLTAISTEIVPEEKRQSLRRFQLLKL